MNIKLLLQLALLILSINCLAQPYGGTIFVESDIIVSTDSSAHVNTVYKGQGFKTIFDRRKNDWITVYAYLFDVIWNDGLSSEAIINPEFGSVELAEIEADKYGFHIGQLPHCLRVDVNEIWINKGVELFGGGNNSILIHTGQTVLYENDGILEETLVHEASHTSLDAVHAISIGWLEAQNLDGVFISDYAESLPHQEDVAESFLMWMAVRYREDRISEQDFNLITDAIPNRLNYFDEVFCDLFPFQIESTTSIDQSDKVENNVVVYPNPTTDFVKLTFDNEDTYRAIIYNCLGHVVLSKDIRNNGSIDLSEVPSGVYFLSLYRDGKQLEKKIIKY